MHDNLVMHRFIVLNNRYNHRPAIPQKPMTTTIILILDRRRMKKGDLYPICLQLNHKNTKLYMNLKDNVAEVFWDQQNQKVLNGAQVFPNVGYVNSHIQGKKTDATRFIAMQEQTGELDMLSPADSNSGFRINQYELHFPFTLIPSSCNSVNMGSKAMQRCMRGPNLFLGTMSLKKLIAFIAMRKVNTGH